MFGDPKGGVLGSCSLRPCLYFVIWGSVFYFLGCRIAAFVAGVKELN